MSNLIACAMPGKKGDFIYSVPAAKYLAELYNCQVDYYTSPLCAGLKRLLEYQPYIRNLIVPEEFTEWWAGWGVQPWDMSRYINGDYKYVFQFGYKNFPDRPLPEFALSENGILGINPPMIGIFDCPWLPVADYEVCKQQPDKHILNEPYVVVASRGDLTQDKLGRTTKDHFYDFAAKCPIRVVQIGGPGESWPWGDSLDATCVDWLETCSWLRGARGFYGLISSQGGMAQSFDIPKVYIHNGGGWDMRHVVRTETSAYYVMPPAEQVLEFMGLR